MEMDWITGEVMAEQARLPRCGRLLVCHAMLCAMLCDAKVFGGLEPRIGEMLYQRELADTYARLVRRPPIEHGTLTSHRAWPLLASCCR